MGSISNLSSNYLQSILNTALQTSGLTTNSSSSASSAGNALQTDSNQLSPFAQLMSTLQQLQQTDPAKYIQVTQQIATNLSAAAQTATTNGNTSAANQLNQLATDFTNASQTGQLPNVQDLAEAMASDSSGGHHHHHHSSSGSSDSTSTSTSSSTATSTAANSALNSLLQAFKAYENQSASLNPYQIISSTLSSAGVTATGTST